MPHFYIGVIHVGISGVLIWLFWVLRQVQVNAIYGNSHAALVTGELHHHKYTVSHFFL